MNWTDDAPTRLAFALVALFGVAGVVVGTTGLYLSLTGPDPHPERGATVLGEYACEPADREAGSGPDASYGIDGVVPRADEVSAVGTNRTTPGPELTVVVEGRVLDAATGRFGDPPRGPGPNATVENDTRVVVADAGAEPFRLWIDSVTAGGSVVRTELDVCPPGDAG